MPSSRQPARSARHQKARSDVPEVAPRVGKLAPVPDDDHGADRLHATAPARPHLAPPPHFGHHGLLRDGTRALLPRRLLGRRRRRLLRLGFWHGRRRGRGGGALKSPDDTRPHSRSGFCRGGGGAGALKSPYEIRPHSRSGFGAWGEGGGSAGSGVLTDVKNAPQRGPRISLDRDVSMGQPSGGGGGSAGSGVLTIRGRLATRRGLNPGGGLLTRRMGRISSRRRHLRNQKV
jgi:hypothetical protein